MDVSYDVTASLRANMKHHEPIVLVFDSRGNGGGVICPTIRADKPISDYTPIVLEVTEE